MALASLRERVEQTRGVGGEPLAVALVELAEAEPLLGHRQKAVRALLEQAAKVLDPLGLRVLEGRVLLRLATVKLSERDLEGSEQLATRARERLASDDPWRVVECAAVLARAAIRRSDLAAAERLLVDVARDDSSDPEVPTARRAVAAVALAYSEIALEQRNYADVDQRLAVLASGIDGAADLIEQRYECHQMRAAVALARGLLDKACHELREVVELAKAAGSVEDELESRIALAGALVERSDPAGREEAEKHLQITRDKAQEQGFESLHMAALVGQAGVLAKRGKTQAALDRCIEIANAAVAKHDLPRYAGAVALMSQIYEQKGDLASAYRTFAEANAALREQIGDAAKDVIRPHLAAFADRIGRDKFQEIAERVTRAANAKSAFRRV
jgi:hypothetical protein